MPPRRCRFRHKDVVAAYCAAADAKKRVKCNQDSINDLAVHAACLETFLCPIVKISKFLKHTFNFDPQIEVVG